MIVLSSLSTRRLLEALHRNSMKFLSLSWNVQSRGQNRATKKPGTKTGFKGSHGLTAQCRFIRKIVQAHHCAVWESFSHANGCEASVRPNLQNTSSHKARLVSNLITDLEISNYPLKISSPNTSPPFGCIYKSSMPGSAWNPTSQGNWTSWIWSLHQAAGGL